MSLRLETASVWIRGKAILDGVSHALRPGALTVVLGANGAGKSTLLRVLSGDLPPTDGDVLLDGTPLRTWSAEALARRRAVVPQSTHPVPLRVAEAVALGRAPHRRTSSAAEDTRAVDAALARTDTAHLADRTVASLSGGERQRVTLARALAQLPDGDDRQHAVLLLDEPTAALDPAHQHAVMRAARDIASQGTAVLAVLHDINLALRYGDDAVLLRQGRMVGAGPAGVVLTPAHLSAAYGCSVRFLTDAAGPPVAVTEAA